MKNPAKRISWAAASLLSTALGCQQSDQVLVPNRVLDRPLDVVLACVRSTDGQVEVLSDDECENAGSPPACGEEGENQLIGFVANSEKNELGMFRRCDINGMVDLDPQAPGYNLIPVGTLPSRVVRTDDCRVVTANVGSCDLSAVDLPKVAAYAVELEPTGASALVSRIIPRRSDGRPLGAAPGDMLAVPRSLSLAGAFAGEGDPAQGGAGVCSPTQSASVYVTFPACQLVAEVELTTQRILQSRQFRRGPDGRVEVVDTGPDPECPIECPRQFDGDLPPEVPADPDGVFPGALALITPTPGDSADDPKNEATRAPRLFVAGTGSDEIFEFPIRVDPSTRAPVGFSTPAETHRLRLEDPAGIANIRVTPPMIIEGAIHQFLYLVAGDGSTHVVDRDLSGNSLGVECDTQVDPTLASNRACHPIDPNSQAGRAARRPFAAGPGIRSRDGSTITDWVFQENTSTGPNRHSPFAGPGVVGIGVTSFGRIVLSVFGQFDDTGPSVTEASDGTPVDPIGLLNTEIRPHMLWPTIDPNSGDPSVLPLVTDAEPTRALPAEDRPTQVLAPSLRRIDLAYYADDTDDFSDAQKTIWRGLNEPDNVDLLGDFEGDALYTVGVPRVAVRDYRQWQGGQTWSVAWEPVVPATESLTGRLACAKPSPYGGGTCHVEPGTRDGVQIIDEGATFCDAGVLPGDRFFIFGCREDGDCGLGQRCLRDPSSVGSIAGICVSARAYETRLQELRQVCAPFIGDPCGAPRREYVITRASQSRLSLGATDIEPTSFLRNRCPTPAGAGNLLDRDAAVPPDRETEDPHECEARLTCRVPEGVEAPIGGCNEDAECEGLGGTTGAEYVCVEGQCRTPCQGGSLNCRQIGLPGPGCFAEFIHYAVGLRDAFGVSVNPGAVFLSDKVVVDPETGECREDPTASNLLTSRIPVGPDQAAVVAQVPRCPNADEASPADPNPCLVAELREQDPGSLYHLFSYGTSPVPALRFSNPYGTLVLDLVSLLDLSTTTDALGDRGDRRPWPAEFAQFRRSRIPRNYREEFRTPQGTGYQTYNDPVVVANTPLTYPVRVIAAPELGTVYIVDAGGRGGRVGVRGQVMRVVISNGRINADDNFRVQ